MSFSCSTILHCGVQGNLPYETPGPTNRATVPSKLTRPLGFVKNCYTQTCYLAAQACAKFANRGYPVMEMEGGFAAWKAADLDIEREPINRLKRTSERLLHRRH
jgi:hypothetical protein